MSAPVIGKGFMAEAVLVPEVVATFGTLEASGQLAFRFVSASETNDYKDLLDNTLYGYGASARHGEADRELHTVTVVLRADYDNTVTFLNGVTGHAAADMTPVAENALIYSLVIDKVVERFQYTGGVIEELRIIGNADTSVIMIEADFIFAKLTKASAAIPAASLTASTFLKMQDATFRIGTMADALTAGDALAITDFTIRIKNNFLIKWGSASQYIIVPIREKPREVYLDITASRYDDSAEIAAIGTAMTGNSILQADLTISDGVSTNNFLAQFAELYPTPNTRLNPPVGDAGPLTFSASFQAFYNLNNGTLMATVTEDIRILTAT